MPNPPDSRDAQAWEIYLDFLTGKTDGDKRLACSAYKAADAFETVRAGHEESLKEPPAKNLKSPPTLLSEIGQRRPESRVPLKFNCQGTWLRSRPSQGQSPGRFFSALSNLIEPELRGIGG